MNYANHATCTGPDCCSKPGPFTATQLTSERPREVLEQINDLRDAVETLGVHLSAMEGRLSPITRQCPIDQGGVVGAQEQTLVPLAESLRKIRREVESYNSRMHYLASNIEL